MRILIIHQSFVDHRHPGGTRHLELATFLCKQGHDVAIVASNVDYLTGQQIAKTRFGFAEQQIGAVRVLRSYAPAGHHRSFGRRVLAFLTFMATSVWTSTRCGPVDVVMGTTPPIFQLPSAWIVSVLRWRPFVLEVRDLWPDFAVELGIIKNRWFIWFARMIERFFYRRANHLVVNSPAYRDHLLSKGIPDAQIAIVPNGVDPAMFTAGDPSTLRDELQLHGKFVVTYAGALGQANDIQTVLRAAERLHDQKDIHFLLFGDGKQRESLESFARDRQLTNVTFGGTIPKRQMCDLLAASDVCIATLKDIPMFRTTYPNKVFDYMAAGKPTLLGIDGVIRKVIEDAQGGIFVPPGDDQALADAVRRLYQDPELVEQMGASARQYVAEHFRREDHARRLETVFGKLVDRSGAAPG